ncbi:hypothetical protein HY338_00590 [Candidatus Gottesmanbacteria bacterium]|nr:hypothetical protein [Candidatus Gottesmanbacteria bacterium]
MDNCLMKKLVLILSLLTFILLLISGFNKDVSAEVQTSPTKLPLISPTLASKPVASSSSSAGLKDPLAQKLFIRIEAVLMRLNKIEEKIIAREGKINTAKKITPATQKNLDKLKTDLTAKMNMAEKQVSSSAKLALDLEASVSLKENYASFRSQIIPLKQIFQDILDLESQQLQILGKLPSAASISATPKK